MKPFFSVDRTENKKNMTHNSACFAAAAVSEPVRRSLGQAAEQSVKQENRAKLPAPLRFIQGASGFVAALLFISIIRALGGVTILEAYANAPGLFWIMGGCALVWAVLACLSANVRKRVTAEEDFSISGLRLDKAMEAAFQELGVPQGAKDVDVIAITHRWKNGKLKLHTKGMEMSPYRNVPFKVFVRENKLCLADLENRYEIDLQSLKCLRSVKKSVTPTGWNKPEAPNEGFYKPYKLSVDQYNRILMKRHGLLEFSHNGEDWAIWLPPYELNYISALTGLKIQEW